jgi:hypothetical protein
MDPPIYVYYELTNLLQNHRYLYIYTTINKPNLSYVYKRALREALTICRIPRRCPCGKLTVSCIAVATCGCTAKCAREGLHFAAFTLAGRCYQTLLLQLLPLFALLVLLILLLFSLC